MNHKKKFSYVPLALGLILILSFFLRFYHLGARPLYGDEPFHTVDIATKSLSYITTSNLGSTLYPLLLHFLLPLGKAETTARLPAALFGFFSVWGIFLLGRLFFKEKEGLLAALFSAVSTYFIYFSQQARGYSGLLFFSIFSLYFFWRAFNENKILHWLLYILSTVLGIYTHFFLLIVIPVHAFFITILIFEKWVKKKRMRTVLVSPKKIRNFVLSIFLIILLAFLLYLPMRRSETVNLFYFFKSSLANITKAEMFLNPASLISVIIKRLLCHETWPTFFFVQLALLIFGIVACFKNCGKSLILFLSYLILPFFLFAMSNPPPVYLTPQDNKFIFILPLLFLLMAKGLSGLHSFLAQAISKLRPVKNPEPLKNGLWVFFVLGFLASQGVFLEDYNFYNWNFLSLKRDREINAYLNQHTSQMELLYSDDFLNKNIFLFLKPLRYPDGSQKGVMIFESDYDYIFATQLYQKMGLSAILNRRFIGEEYISRLKAISSTIDVKKITQYFLVHFPSGEKTLYEQLIPMINLLTGLPWAREKKTEYHLLLAKIHLLARRNQEAMKELEAFDRLKSESSQRMALSQKPGLAQEIIKKYFFLNRESPQAIIQDKLIKNIQEHLMENADQLLLEGKFDEAFLLQKKAESFNSQQFKSTLWFHLSLAESYLKKEMRDEAVNEYKNALPLCTAPKDETYVLRKIREIRGLPFGYFIWQKKGQYHLRWWSDEKRTFTGTITSSRPFRSVGEYHLTPNDDYKLFRKNIIFKGIVEGNRIEGLDLFIKSHSRLTFLLKINGRKNIEERVLLLPEESHPQEMPFSLKE